MAPALVSISGVRSPVCSRRWSTHRLQVLGRDQVGPMTQFVHVADACPDAASPSRLIGQRSPQFDLWRQRLVSQARAKGWLSLVCLDVPGAPLTAPRIRGCFGAACGCINPSCRAACRTWVRKPLCLPLGFQCMVFLVGRVWTALSWATFQPSAPSQGNARWVSSMPCSPPGYSVLPTSEVGTRSGSPGCPHKPTVSIGVYQKSEVQTSFSGAGRICILDQFQSSCKDPGFSTGRCCPTPHAVTSSACFQCRLIS